MPSSADINAQIHQWMRDAILMCAEGGVTGVVAVATGDYTNYRAYLFRGLARRALGNLAGALQTGRGTLSAGDGDLPENRR